MEGFEPRHAKAAHSNPCKRFANDKADSNTFANEITLLRRASRTSFLVCTRCRPWRGLNPATRRAAANRACLGRAVLVFFASSHRAGSQGPKPRSRRLARQDKRTDLRLASQSVREKSGQFLQDDWLRGCAERRASLLISSSGRPEPHRRVIVEASFLRPEVSC